MATTTLTSMTMNNGEGKSFELPEALKARCMRVYGWNEEFVNKALVGYQQFMKLKLQHEDWSATILSPALIVDKVWHQHILDVQHYVKACHDFTGGSDLIGHNPDAKAKAGMVQATKLCLITLLGCSSNLDGEIWSFGEDSDDDVDHDDDVDEGDRKKRRRVLSIPEKDQFVRDDSIIQIKKLVRELQYEYDDRPKKKELETMKKDER